MAKSDDSILEFLYNDPNPPIVAPPAVIADNIGKSKSTVQNRLPKLLNAGLIGKYHDRRGVYEITDKGVAYLEGRLDEDDLQLAD